MQLRSGSFAHGQPIPAANAFGKPGAPGSVQDLTDDTGWFAGDAEMSSDYLGCDGPYRRGTTP